MNDKVINIFNPDGSVGQYRRLSDRIGDFLEKYPPGDGWKVQRKTMDLLSLQPGMLSLIKEAIVNGQKPADLGLLQGNDVGQLVFQTELIHPNGNVVMNASASGKIVDYKDFERFETASYQRLLAALGFGGDVFDDDEAGDMEKQNLRTESLSPSKPAVSDHRGIDSVSHGARTEPAKDRPIVGVAVTSGKDDSFVPIVEVETIENPEGPAVEPPEGVPPAMQRQIVNLASRLGTKTPSYSDMDGAKRALKDLNALQRQRRA